MSMTYHDKIFLVPLARGKDAMDEHGIGRSPRLPAGWWLVATCLFYAAVALVCLAFLT